MPDEQRRTRTAQGDASVAGEAERAIEAYGSAVRSTLRNNATAYGFSISITSAFGLLTWAHGQPDAVEIVLFALGAACGFVLIGSLLAPRFSLRGTSDSETVMLLNGAADLLSVVCAVGVGIALSLLPPTAAWPVTGFGTIVVFLLVGGIDVLIARFLARRI